MTSSLSDTISHCFTVFPLPFEDEDGSLNQNLDELKRPAFVNASVTSFRPLHIHSQNYQRPSLISFHRTSSSHPISFRRTTLAMKMSAPKWDELVPLLAIFDTKGILEVTLDIPGSPHHQHPRQHSNIRAAIALYENGKLDGSKAPIVGGEVVSNEEAVKARFTV